MLKKKKKKKRTYVNIYVLFFLFSIYDDTGPIQLKKRLKKVDEDTANNEI